MAQSSEEVQKIWQTFLESSEGSNVIASDYNALVFKKYLDAHHQGVVSHAALVRGMRDPDVIAKLRLKTSVMTAAEIQQKADEERRQNEEDRINQIAAAWIRDNCPLGLLEGADLYKENSDRIVAWVRRHGGEVSPELFDNAVRALTKTNSLVWLSDETELRNQPAPPSRESRLSHQAQIDAGLIPDDSITKLRSHSKDGSLVNPAEKMREIVKTLFPDNPWEIKANLLVIQDRRGRIDQGKTSQLRQVFVERNGKTDWELTYKKRNEICDGADRLRNRD